MAAVGAMLRLAAGRNVGGARADPWRCAVHVDVTRGVPIGFYMRAVAIARDRR